MGFVVLAMLTFPPYQIHGWTGVGHVLVKNGYAFIFTLPDLAKVDATTLLVQWVGVLIVGSIGFFLVKDK